MVGVGVRVDHRRHRQALADLGLEQLPGGAHRLGTDQRVEDDPAGFAAHEGDIGQVEAAHLIDARDHLVEPVVVVQPGLTEQRGVDAVEFFLLVQKLEPLHVPGNMTGIRLDLQLLHRGNQPLLLFLEIPGVAEWQGRLCFLQCVQREL